MAREGRGNREKIQIREKKLEGKWEEIEELRGKDQFQKLYINN